MSLKKSSEDYLETILLLEKRTGYVRSIDIANEMGFSKPSISRAMNKLKVSGYITVDEHGQILLSEEGRRIAGNVYERHRILKCFLMSLGISKEAAAADACLVEHDLSQESFDRIKEHYEKLIKESRDE
ncbi:MAG: metal-dependent transcriptional regulator [Christensenellales bacterium]|jgi:DtxR family Mn-dependent transcriptional regulator